MSSSVNLQKLKEVELATIQGKVGILFKAGERTNQCIPQVLQMGVRFDLQLHFWCFILRFRVLIWQIQNLDFMESQLQKVH